MHEFKAHLHLAIDAALEGDRQALFIARWMLQTLELTWCTQLSADA